jgi:hypothetical protein
VSEVGVEGPHRHENGVGIFAELADAVVAVADVAEPFLPAAGHLIGEVEGIEAGLVELEVSPEEQHQLGGQLSERGVVHGGLALVEVIDEQVPHRPADHLVAVDELLHGQLAAAAGRPDRRRVLRRQEAGLSQQQIPVAVLAGGVADLGPVGLDAVGHGDVGQPAAVVDEDPGQLVVGEGAVQGGESLGPFADGVEGGESFRVVELGEPVEHHPRAELVEPVVGRPKRAQEDHTGGRPGEVAAAGGGHLLAVDLDTIGPVGAGTVSAAGQPPLLPAHPGERLQPVEQETHCEDAPLEFLGRAGVLDLSEPIEEPVSGPGRLLPAAGAFDHRRGQVRRAEVMGRLRGWPGSAPLTGHPLTRARDGVHVDVDDVGHARRSAAFPSRISNASGR